jgi:hypothetical protein
MDSATIKSYLISLGFEADDNMYRKFSAALTKASNEVQKHTGIMSNSYVKASGVIIGAVGSIITSTTMLLDSLAKADLGYEKYAMRMYMARDAAKQFKIVTDTMGESLEDIAWIPELNERYRALMSEAKKMELPSSYQEQMMAIRNIGFEFTRLKIEATYGLQWIGYSLIKHLFKPISDSKNTFKSFNDYIVEKMPIWSEKIASVFSKVLNIILDNGKALTWLIEKINNFWVSLTDTEKLAAFGTALTMLFIAGGPVTKAIIGFGLLALAISDFMGYLDGKKTIIDPEIFESVIWLTDKMTLGSKTAFLALKSLAVLFAGFGAAAINRDFGILKQAIKDVGNIWGEFVNIEDKKLKQQDEESKKRLQKAKEITVNAESWDKQQPQIIAAAQKASKETGVPAQLIYSQWAGETANFTNRGARELNNFAGVNIPGGKGEDYRKFASPAEFGDYWSSMINRSYPEAREAKTPAEFANALKKGRIGAYYSDSIENYTQMVQSHMGDYNKAVGNNVVTHNWNITGSKSDAEAIAAKIRNESGVNNILMMRSAGVTP